ncbi:MAG: ABC transporter substrate-binding protein [Deltaproteobacteria bacterium]|nr:ABC transporter substrate-binding protein [Deltaproteobacteria bacterium]
MVSLLVSFLTFFVIWMSPREAGAQKVYRVAALLAEEQFAPAIEGFKKKMAELGYIEGKNIQCEVYNAQLDRKKLQQFAEKMIQDKPDLIVTSSTTATVPVAKLTRGSNLPVVFLSSGNPLELVKSYASSGNNLTGISSGSLELTAKRLELLRDLAPGVKRVVALNNPKGVNYRENLAAVQAAAKNNGITIHEVKASSGEELRRVMPTITHKTAHAIVLQPDVLFGGFIDIIVEHSLREKLPVIPTLIPQVYKGALATYGPDYFSLGEQGAMLVHKIFKGARPSDLPIEYPDKLKLVINLKSAKAIGLKIPKEILLRADEVIE